MVVLKKRRRLNIAYDAQEKVFFFESKSRHGFYHEISKHSKKGWVCNCEAKIFESENQSQKLQSKFKQCRHIMIVRWYIKHQPEKIDTLISHIPFLPAIHYQRQQEQEQEKQGQKIMKQKT